MRVCGYTRACEKGSRRDVERSAIRGPRYVRSLSSCDEANDFEKNIMWCGESGEPVRSSRFQYLLVVGVRDNRCFNGTRMYTCS